MRKVVFLQTILIVSVVSGGPAWKEVQRGSGLKIGTTGNKNSSAVRGNGSNSSGIKLGGSTRGMRSTTTSIPEEDHIFAPTAPSIKTGITHLHVGIMVPYKSFGAREYNKAASSATSYVQRKLKFFKNHDIQVHLEMKEMTPSPTAAKLRPFSKEVITTIMVSYEPEITGTFSIEENVKSAKIYC